MNWSKNYRTSLCFFIFLLISTGAWSQTKVPVVELRGTPYERGLSHGIQLKSQITEVYGKWKDNIRKMGFSNPDSLLKAFLATTDFEPAIQKYLPEIKDELRGIAEGSGQPLYDVYAFQLVDEFWIYLDKIYNEEKHHCSGVGVPATKNHPAYIAQNMDLENYMQGYQVLLHIPANGKVPEQYILTCAGLVALGGMNGSGIALCMNTIMELKASTDGLPVAFMIRGVLSQNNAKDALAFLKNTKHASGQNYILGAGDSVYNFEASASKVVRYLPSKNSSIVYHTNHALVNDDVKPWHQKAYEQRLAGTKTDNSVIRFVSLEQRMNKNPEGINTDHIKSTLRAKDNPNHPVCRPHREGGGGFTFSSIIYTIGGKRSIQLTYGSPDQAEYVEYFFK